MRIGGFCAIAGLVAACSGGDPGAVNIVPRDHSAKPPTGPVVPVNGDASVAVIPNDSGRPVDAGGVVEAAAPLAPFKGAPPYAPNPVGDRAANHHTVAVQGFTNPAGRDCFACHNGGGALQFVLGATVYSSAAATTPLADAEVRVVNAAGKQVASVHSDVDGNFWLSAVAPVPAGSLVGVRNATTATEMVGTISTGGCASGTCHIAGVGGAQGPIHLP